MKHLPSIISKLLYEPLIVTPQKHLSICRAIDAHLTRSAHVIESRAQSDDQDLMGEGQYEDRRIGNVAIINVYGVIEKHMEKMASAAPGCDLDIINAMIDTAEADPSISRIGFDFRTPGGAVTGTPETARKIARCSKETFAFTDSECCSGGMYLASQCQKFYCTGSSRLGSIGVWCAYLDLSRQMANDGEKMQAISAGKYKLMGAYWKPLTDEETAIIQARMDKILAGFKTAVCAVRVCSDDAMGNGLIFDGEEAADRGLVDGVVEDLEEVLEEMVE